VVFSYFSSLRNRIVSALVKGIAADDPFYSHPGTLQGAVFVNSLVAVVRTGRVIAAGSGGKRRGNDNLIGADK